MLSKPKAVSAPADLVGAFGQSAHRSGDGAHQKYSEHGGNDCGKLAHVHLSAST
jgi:hypothetical protein